MELDQDVNFDWTGETLYPIPRSMSIILDTDLILHLFVAFRSNNNIGRGPFPYVTNTSWPHHIYFSVFHGVESQDTYFKQWAVIVFIHMIRLIVSIINISFRMISHSRQKAETQTRDLNMFCCQFYFVYLSQPLIPSSVVCWIILYTRTWGLLS